MMGANTVTLSPSTYDRLKELQAVRRAAGAPEMTIEQLAELLLEKLRESSAKGRARVA